MPDNTCVCCGRIIPEGRQICLACGDYDDMQTFKPRIRTLGDQIRAMSNRELARFICLQQLHQSLTGTVEAEETVLKALESEVKNELDPNH